MLKTFALICFGIAGAAVGSAQTFLFGQTYKVGDSTTFVVTTTRSPGDQTTETTVTEEVVKVYDNGDADMKETVSEMIVNGKPLKLPPAALQPITMRLNKFGAPVDFEKSNAAPGYAEVLAQFKSGISLGQTLNISYTRKGPPEVNITGKITFVSEDTTAKFHLETDTTGEPTGPSHLEGDMNMDPTTKKLVSMDIVITRTGTRPGTSHMVMKVKSP